MRILGISAFYHDSATALLEEGRIVAALQEERFSRRKHDSSFPDQAIAAALRLGRCTIQDVNYVVFYEKPFLKFERLLETYLNGWPKGFASYLKSIPLWIKEKIWIKETIGRRLQYEGEVLFADHHESHAASAFYPSPFRSAAVLTLDAVGEWTTSALGRGCNHDLQLESELRFPHSLGLLYTAFTYYLGFEVNSGEYKVMGLAPYGRPVYENLIKDHLVSIREDGSFHLNTEYFDFETGLKMTSRAFERLFAAPPREPQAALTQEHKDIAASVQKVTEEIILRMAHRLYRQTGEHNLCMAGGVALNCVANGRVLRETDFKHLWVQPAAGDAGGALGAALAVWYRWLGNNRSCTSDGDDRQSGSLLGTSYSADDIRNFLHSVGARYEELNERELNSHTACWLADGAIIGWYQGSMEFGPRALGGRSILADARGADMKDRLNLRVKFRESFRPFAPAVLEERATEYFELDRPSPYMLLVAAVRESRRGEIPAVTHVDGSARIQTVSRRTNRRFYTLLDEFYRQTGCAVLLNTSFNIAGEPIVESPDQAYQSFMRTGMDLLVMENFMLKKTDQPRGL